MIEIDNVIGRDDLLDKASDRLNHVKPVGRLNAGSLQAVVEHGIFVGDQIETGGVFHDTNTDVVRVLACEQGIEVVDDTAECSGGHGEGKLRGDEPPQPRSGGLMSSYEAENGIDNEL